MHNFLCTLNYFTAPGYGNPFLYFRRIDIRKEG